MVTIRGLRWMLLAIPILIMGFLSTVNLAQQSAGSAVWVNIGPSPILPAGTTGRVNDVAVDPGDTNHWLIAAPGGGVWETRDGGQAWTPLTDAEEVQAMGAVAFAPGDHSVIYAGTGEGIGFSSLGGRGILKSTDGGASWQLVGRAAFEKTGITDLRIDPANPDTLIVGSMFANQGRSTRGTGVPTNPGVYKSTDGGGVWTRVLPGECMDLETDPGDFSRQYAAIGFRQERTNPEQKGIYRSMDGGDTWSKITGPWSSLPANALGRGELAIAPSQSSTLYVSIADQGSTQTLIGLWRTDDAWDPVPIWTQISTAPIDGGTGAGYCGHSCYYSNDLLVDPFDPDILYAAGERVWQWNDGSWNPTAFGSTYNHHVMAFAGTRLIVGNEGGVYSSLNPLGMASNHNTNLSITQFYAGSIHPGSGQLALGGADVLGSLKRTGLNSWSTLLQGYGSDTAISPTNPDTHLAVSLPGNDIYRSIDGSRFALASGGIAPGFGGVIEHFEMCPNNENVVVAGSRFILWRTDDFFSALRVPAWSENSPQLAGFIEGIAFAPSDTTCSTYAVGDFSDLRLTTDGGASWVDLDPSNAVPDRFVTDLAFHPDDSNILYVTLQGYEAGTPTPRPGHVFKTTGALSGAPLWVDVSPPDDAPFNTVVLDPRAPDTVYAGSEFGMWKSLDGGVTWNREDAATGLPTGARIFEIQSSAQSGRLAAFTHGRGAYVLTSMGECPGGTEADSDSDGVGDSCDNCPATPNFDQSNLDGDAFGDACDVCVDDPLNDADGDGICASVDSCPNEAPQLGLDADQDGCTDTIAALIDIVQGLDAKKNFKNGLLAKLNEAQRALDRGNSNVAVNALNDFINQVNGKRGNGIAEADADLLIAYANNLIQLISG